jgi:hypothetical protein
MVKEQNLVDQEKTVKITMAKLRKCKFGLEFQI